MRLLNNVKLTQFWERFLKQTSLAGRLISLSSRRRWWGRFNDAILKWHKWRLGSVCTLTPEKLQNVALFIRFGPPSSLIRLENEAFRKRSSNRRHWKTLALRFSVAGKHFEIGAFWKRSKVVTIILWFFCLVFFKHRSKRSGDWCVFEFLQRMVDWTQNILCVFRVKPPFSNSSAVVWTGPWTRVGSVSLQFIGCSKSQSAKRQLDKRWITVSIPRR